MVGFIIGLIVGGVFGVVIMCIMFVAGKTDEENEHDDSPRT